MPPLVRRWTEKEINMIAEMRQRCKAELELQPPFPEVIGDRRLIRFIRGQNYDIDKATKLFRDMLQWRQEFNVNEMRNNIVYGKASDPKNFPYADILMKHAYQIVCAADALDVKGNPMSLETYDFSPVEVLKEVTLAQYIEFLTYTLEYKALIIEQLSEERERKYLESVDNNPPETESGYGIIVQVCIIRDLSGFGSRHMTSQAKEIVGAGLKVGVNHYNEFMSKGVMVNVPSLFTFFWVFVKLFLDAKTIAKIGMYGTSFLKDVINDLPIGSIPSMLGGQYKGDNEFYEFDVRPGGCLYYDGAPAAREPFQKELLKSPSDAISSFNSSVTTTVQALPSTTKQTHIEHDIPVLLSPKEFSISNSQTGPQLRAATSTGRKLYEKKIPPYFVPEKSPPMSFLQSITLNINEYAGIFLFFVILLFLLPNIAALFILPLVLYHML